MSQDEESWLEDKGFDVKIARGKSIIGDAGHVWIVINFAGLWLHIDSISLLPLPMSFLNKDITYFESYEEYVLWKNGYD